MNNIDETENVRRVLTAVTNAQATENPDDDRKRLEKDYGVGNVWDTQQLSEKFKVLGFMAPFCVVEDKATSKKGSVMFQHYPRFYFGWQQD